jgi:hypothetical protein
MLHILAIMPLRAHVNDAADLVEEIDLNGIACDRGHRNYHFPKHPAIRCSAISVTLRGVPLKWKTQN